jgi:hypothetical protein
MLNFMKTPEHDLMLSNGAKVKYRPFLVKEEKILLMSVENNVEQEMVDTLIKTVQTCVLTDGIDVTKLPVYDFEWLWLNIRSKSIGETVQLKLKCPDDETQIVDYDFNIESVKPDFSKEVKTHIPFTKEYGVIMKVPTIIEVSDKKTIIDLTVNLMRDCIAQIYNGDEVFETKDLEPKELEQFVDNLTMPQFKKLKDFFETLPIISHTIKYKNPKSGVEHEMLLQGASDFFQLPSYMRA